MNAPPVANPVKGGAATTPPQQNRDENTTKAHASDSILQGIRARLAREELQTQQQQQQQQQASEPLYSTADRPFFPKGGYISTHTSNMTMPEWTALRKKATKEAVSSELGQSQTQQSVAASSQRDKERVLKGLKEKLRPGMFMSSHDAAASDSEDSHSDREQERNPLWKKNPLFMKERKPHAPLFTMGTSENGPGHIAFASPFFGLGGSSAAATSAGATLGTQQQASSQSQSQQQTQQQNLSASVDDEYFEVASRSNTSHSNLKKERTLSRKSTKRSVIDSSEEEFYEIMDSEVTESVSSPLSKPDSVPNAAAVFSKQPTARPELKVTNQSGAQQTPLSQTQRDENNPLSPPSTARFNQAVSFQETLPRGSHASSASPRKSLDTELNHIGEKIKVANTGGLKSEVHFSNLRRLQVFQAHQGGIWSMKFNRDGSFLATCGQDGRLIIWSVGTLANPNPGLTGDTAAGLDGSTSPGTMSPRFEPANLEPNPSSVEDSFRALDFMNDIPLRTFKAHKADILELSWSSSNFMLSVSMDKTARLWHPSTGTCLRKFVHPDVVTTGTFHPHDENVFISGCVDGFVRIWAVRTQKILAQANAGEIVTTCTISRDGKTALVGTYSGFCLFFSIFNEASHEWRLKLITKLDLRAKVNMKQAQMKVLGFDFLPGSDEWMVVSCDDLRVRLFQAKDNRLKAGFFIPSNVQRSLRASVSPKGGFFITGCENSPKLYIWNLLNASPNLGPSSTGQVFGADEDKLADGKVKSCETFLAFEGKQKSNISCVIFAPHVDESRAKRRSHGLFIIAANDQGQICVMENI